MILSIPPQCRMHTKLDRREVNSPAALVTLRSMSQNDVGVEGVPEGRKKESSVGSPAISNIYVSEAKVRRFLKIYITHHLANFYGDQGDEQMLYQCPLTKRDLASQFLPELNQRADTSSIPSCRESISVYICERASRILQLYYRLRIVRDGTVEDVTDLLDAAASDTCVRTRSRARRIHSGCVILTDVFAGKITDYSST